DRKPVDNDPNGEMWNFEIFGEGGGRWRCGGARHVDLGKAQRPDVQPPGQQLGRRDIEGEIPQGKIGAVAIGDLDPVNLQMEWHEPAKPFNGDSKIGTAKEFRYGSCQPNLPGSGLQQPEGSKDKCDH